MAARISAVVKLRVRRTAADQRCFKSASVRVRMSCDGDVHPLRDPRIMRECARFYSEWFDGDRGLDSADHDEEYSEKSTAANVDVARGAEENAPKVVETGENANVHLAAEEQATCTMEVEDRCTVEVDDQTGKGSVRMQRKIWQMHKKLLLKVIFRKVLKETPSIRMCTEIPFFVKEGKILNIEFSKSNGLSWIHI